MNSKKGRGRPFHFIGGLNRSNCEVPGFMGRNRSLLTAGPGHSPKSSLNPAFKPPQSAVWTPRATY